MTGIFRPRQPAVQRVTANAGNRGFIAGGHGANRMLPTVVPHLALKLAALAVLVSGGGPVEPPEQQEQQGGPGDDI